MQAEMQAQSTRLQTQIDTLHHELGQVSTLLFSPFGLGRPTALQITPTVLALSRRAPLDQARADLTRLLDREDWENFQVSEIQLALLNQGDPTYCRGKYLLCLIDLQSDWSNMEDVYLFVFSSLVGLPRLFRTICGTRSQNLYPHCYLGVRRPLEARHQQNDHLLSRP